MLITMGITISRFMVPLLPASLTPYLPASLLPLCPSAIAPSAIHKAETALLSHLTSTPYTKRAIHLPRTGHILNTISVGSPTLPALLLLHGWGSGVAFFGLNMSGLSQHFRVHVVDWLGFGGSSRPQHDVGMSAKEAEGFFIEPLAEWLEVMRGLEGFEGGVHVVGHSMGAYLSVGFALGYPGLVRNLVLASPVGVPKAPGDKLGKMAGGWKRKMVFGVVFWLWERGWTPQMLVRYAGRVLGRGLAGKMILRRFPMKDRGGEEALVEYFYQISAAKGSGEFSLCTVLESGAYARRPLCERIGDVQVPVAFLYGERDWMSVDSGREVAGGLKVSSWVKSVAGAGHHVYFDNAEEFNRLVIEACAGIGGTVER